MSVTETIQQKLDHAVQVLEPKIEIMRDVFAHGTALAVFLYYVYFPLAVSILFCITFGGISIGLNAISPIAAIVVPVLCVGLFPMIHYLADTLDENAVSFSNAIMQLLGFTPMLEVTYPSKMTILNRWRTFAERGYALRTKGHTDDAHVTALQKANPKQLSACREAFCNDVVLEEYKMMFAKNGLSDPEAAMIHARKVSHILAWYALYTRSQPFQWNLSKAYALDCLQNETNGFWDNVDPKQRIWMEGNPKYICGISGQVMQDPVYVLAPNGIKHYFERLNLERSLSRPLYNSEASLVNPITGVRICSPNSVIPDLKLKAEIYAARNVFGFAWHRTKTFVQERVNPYLCYLNVRSPGAVIIPDSVMQSQPGSSHTAGDICGAFTDEDYAQLYAHEQMANVQLYYWIEKAGLPHDDSNEPEYVLETCAALDMHAHLSTRTYRRVMAMQSKMHAESKEEPRSRNWLPSGGYFRNQPMPSMTEQLIEQELRDVNDAADIRCLLYRSHG